MSKTGEHRYYVTLIGTGWESGLSLRVTARLLSGLLIGFFSLIAAASVVAAHYYQVWNQGLELARVEEEVDTLRRSNEAFRVSAKQLSDQISALQITAQKLKLGAGLDDDAFVGIGGPSNLPDPVFSLNERDLMKHFRTLDRKRITLKSEFRRLQDYYTTRQILQAATPSIMPVRGYPSDRFGRRVDPFNGMSDFHPGIDISAPRGAKVMATADGLVVFAGRQAGYGKIVRVEHKLGVSTRYGHLDRYTVTAGDRVKKGDIIGYVGSTGRATGPHVHYEVRLNSEALNPLRFFQDSP